MTENMYEVLRRQIAEFCKVERTEQEVLEKFGEAGLELWQETR